MKFFDVLFGVKNKNLFIGELVRNQNRSPLSISPRKFIVARRGTGSFNRDNYWDCDNNTLYREYREYFEYGEILFLPLHPVDFTGARIPIKKIRESMEKLEKNTNENLNLK